MVGNNSSKEKTKEKKVSGKDTAGEKKLKTKEIEELIVELAHAGNTPSQIGIILRDQYGIASTKEMAKKKIEKIMEEKGVGSELPRDLLNLIKKSVNEHKHMERNRKDMVAKRGYQLTVSKIRRLTKYYVRKGKLPEGWRYTPEKAALLVK
ncbi:MAG: 30S ribosomal protein S15 [archaeon]